jgi:hypothetical protein
VTDLETELEEIDAKKQEFEDLITEESQSQGRNLQLEESQVRILVTGPKPATGGKPSMNPGYRARTFNWRKAR